MAGIFDLKSSSPPDTSDTPDTGGARREFNKDSKMNKFKCPVGQIRDHRGNCVPDKMMKKQAEDTVREVEGALSKLSGDTKNNKGRKGLI